MKYTFYILSLFIIVLSACSPKKYILINEPKLEQGDSSFYKTIRSSYYIQPGDILYISIHSTLSETDGIFHFPGQEEDNVSGGSQGINIYLKQFVIDDAGNIRIPVIGTIYVTGSTVEEIEKIVEIEARKYVHDALARVKLVSYEITFLGEFGEPGKITFYKDRVNILDAIASAGEVTYYANRKNIRVLRQTKEGIYSYRIDLTDIELLESNKFYLQPNDIVYAEPSARRIFRVNAADYSVVLATITSTIAFITLMISLKN
ncbi:MAG: polysaccharide biosynthesis/export family protein [Bacteroidales bacterium]|nr:polysaccharide biosynthesis/export family protein [Bacteroidales bacterium]